MKFLNKTCCPIIPVLWKMAISPTFNFFFYFFCFFYFLLGHGDLVTQVVLIQPKTYKLISKLRYIVCVAIKKTVFAATCYTFCWYENLHLWNLTYFYEYRYAAYLIMIFINDMFTKVRYIFFPSSNYYSQKSMQYFKKNTCII